VPPRSASAKAATLAAKRRLADGVVPIALRRIGVSTRRLSASSGRL
jgi:hypothetical protein